MAKSFHEAVEEFLNDGDSDQELFALLDGHLKSQTTREGSCNWDLLRSSRLDGGPCPGAQGPSRSAAGNERDGLVREVDRPVGDPPETGPEETAPVLREATGGTSSGAFLPRPMLKVFPR